MTDQELSAICRDMEKCELGMMLTKGKTRKVYADHLKACQAALREELSKTECNLTNEELLRELLA